MYRYNIEERVFIVRSYWKSGSIKMCKREFLNKFGGRSPPSKSCIHYLAKKLETTGSLLDVHSGGRPKMPEQIVRTVQGKLLASPNISLRQLSQEMGISKSSCQRAVKASYNLPPRCPKCDIVSNAAQTMQEAEKEEEEPVVNGVNKGLYGAEKPLLEN